jgi:hypothetical protein
MDEGGAEGGTRIPVILQHINIPPNRDDRLHAPMQRKRPRIRDKLVLQIKHRHFRDVLPVVGVGPVGDEVAHGRGRGGRRGEEGWGYDDEVVEVCLDGGFVS